MGLVKLLIRVFALVGKEITEVFRRPGAVLSLVLGPFLILAVFGLGYQGFKKDLVAIIVVDPSSELPQEAEAYRNLATALQTKGDINGAVAALEKYTKLRPRSIEGQTTLAGLYSSLAAKVQPQLQAIQTGDSALLPAFNSGVQVGNHTIVEPNRVFEAVANVQNNRLTELLARQQKNYSAAEKAYQRVARLQPRDAPTQLGLAQAAQQAGDTTTAIAAYRRFIDLAPDDPTSAIVRQQIKALRQASTPGVSAG